MTDEPVLSAADREKLDSSPDDAFYEQPRFVHHVDAGFRERLTDLYRDHLADGDRVLDAMSSWVSHLPDDREFARVVGHGLNAAELAENPRLDGFVVRNLNENPTLPFDDASFDAVLCAVSVQYLQYPTAVFREFHRVLAPGGVLVVSFSNRAFHTKAVRAWRERSMDERVALVREYCETAGFGRIETIREPRSAVLPGLGDDPFYAVVAHRD